MFVCRMTIWLCLFAISTSQLNSNAQNGMNLTDVKRHVAAPKKDYLSVQLTSATSAECFSKCMNNSKISTSEGLNHNKKIKQRSRDWRPWIYGFVCTSLINLASVVGYALKPVMNKSYFGWILMLLVALAIGSMAGSGILHLIPQGFGVTESDGYVGKALVISFGLYCFYLIDRILKILMLKRTKFTKHPSAASALQSYDDQINAVQNDAQLVGQIDPTSIGDPMNPYRTQLLPPSEQAKTRPTIFVLDFELHPINRPKFYNFLLRANDETQASKKLKANNGIVVIEPHNIGSSHDHHHHHHRSDILSSVAPVAWMVVIGDALHNFVDGLAIGAAFTDDFTKAISVCLAVAFEEIPNELGDFAVLLNSGLKINYAISLNFAAACSNYIGLAVGITLGEISAIHDWIYCAAGGMFLYISLVVMVSELNHIGDRLAAQTTKSMWVIFILQNIGLLLGFLIMLFMAVYGDKISLSMS